jgi:hypothetical protein
VSCLNLVCKAACKEGNEVKMCKGLEVRLHLFLPSALDVFGGK